MTRRLYYYYGAGIVVVAITSEPSHNNTSCLPIVCTPIVHLPRRLFLFQIDLTTTSSVHPSIVSYTYISVAIILLTIVGEKSCRITCTTEVMLLKFLSRYYVFHIVLLLILLLYFVFGILSSSTPISTSTR